MAGVAIPFFGGFIENRNLKTAARNIAGDIFEYRERALAENRLYRIIFNVGANNYEIKQCATPETEPCPNDNYITLLTKSPDSENSITMTDAPFGAGNTLTLQGRGVSSPAGHVTLKNKRESTATVTVNFSGRTYVDWTGTLK